MKKSILIELRAAVAIDDYVQKKDYVQSRIDDYSRGLEIFFNKIDTSKCDVVFVCIIFKFFFSELAYIHCLIKSGLKL